MGLINWKADKPMQNSWIPSLKSATRLRKIMKTSISYKILCSVQDFPLKNMSCSISIDETEDFNIITLALKAKAFCLFQGVWAEKGPLQQLAPCTQDVPETWRQAGSEAEPVSRGQATSAGGDTVTAVGTRKWEREVTAFFSIRSSQPCQFLVLLQLRQTVAAHGQEA